jgi:phosphoribosylformylglycinamidine cyclo-ligase
VRALQEASIDIHYMVNITGHGWRKLMRATQPFKYVIETLPEVPAELSLIQKQANISDREMYGNFNMGAGFAIYVAESEAEKVVQLAELDGFKAIIAGRVEDGPKQVIIEPLDITFQGDTLEVR